MSAPLRFAVIGCGAFAQAKLIPNLLRSSPAMKDAHQIFRSHMRDPRPCPWRLDRTGGARPPQIYPLLDDRHPDIGKEDGISGWLAKKAAACEEATLAGDPLRQFTAEPDKGHAHALERFVDEVCGAGPIVCGIDDAVQATRVALAAIRSVQEARIVAMSEV